MVLLVILPASIVAGYSWLIAADRYESEARFVLRTPGHMLPPTALSSLLQSGGPTRANDDGFIVREFLESRDAVTWLQKNFPLKETLSAAKWDPFWRFPNFFAPDNHEGLYRQYRRFVTANYDDSTGVSTLKIQAFSADEAHRLAEALLKGAEGLVNRLNERARHDAISSTEAEADRVRQRTVAAQSAITAFREREHLIDPSQVTLAVLEAIARLSTDAANVSVQINELTRSSPNAPLLATLRTKRSALEEQIAKERQRLAGDAKSIAPRIAEYEGLMLDREFAQRALMAAMTAVEVARVEALRQQVYLEQVATPSQPDYPAYPWRFVWCIVALIAGYMTWRMWRIFANDSVRHIEV